MSTPYPWADEPAAPSQFAPGRIVRTSSGWNVTTPAEHFFVPDSSLRDVPEEVAPVAAIFRARSARKESWGWILYARDVPGRIDVFKDLRDFTVTTPRETFYVLRGSGQDFTLSPGRPGVRRISIEEYLDSTQNKKSDFSDSRYGSSRATDIHSLRLSANVDRRHPVL